MRTDRETLCDLEVFECRHGGHPVMRFVDRCRTAGGSAFLKDLVKNGPGPDFSVRDLQEMTRFFHDEAPELAFPIGDKDAQDLELYLESNYMGVDLTLTWNRYLQSYAYRYQYPEMFQFCRVGLQDALRSIQACGRFIEGVRSHGNCPQGLKRVIDEFHKLYKMIDVEKIVAQGKDPSTVDVFVIDYLLRIQNKENLRKMLEIMYRLDAHLGMAIATRENGFAFPTIVDNPVRRLEIRGLFHPFLSRPVRNDFLLDEERNLLFLTGPNMAGKSTFMKAVGISLVLAHIGMGVPAESMTVSPVDYLFCELTMHDDVRLGISGFMAEVVRIQRILQFCAGKLRLMVIIDEIFKGTNVLDAFECSKLVINGLAGLRKHFFLISSHLVELEPEIRPNGNIRFQCFDAEIREGRLAFRYRLADGVSNTRIGTKLLEEHGVTTFFRDEARSRAARN